MKLAIIGGSGVYDPKIFSGESLEVETPYGKAEVFRGSYDNREVFFIARHGRRHEFPPHRVNYRANIYALKKLGVERIIAINSVGAINPEMKPGSFIVPHDIIDFTRRPSTFYDEKAVHVDFTEPFCSELRKALIESVRHVKGRVFTKAVYAVMQGPRFESAAEIKMLSILGADLVGMTAMPEAALARELEICYASLCISANLAAGIKGERLTATEVVEVVKKAEGELKEIIRGAIPLIPEERNCICSRALEDAEL